MNRFFTCFLTFVSIFLCEYFYPATVYGQNGYLNQKDETSSDAKKSTGLFSQTPKQDDVKTPSTALFQEQANAIKNNDALMRGPGGDPIGGVTPIGSGFQILAGLSFFYAISIALIRLKTKGKIKISKTALAFFILLSASLLQTYAQPPTGSTMLYKNTFGGDAASTPKFSPTGISRGWTNLGFVTGGYTGLPAPNTGNQPSDGKYTIATSTAGAGFAAWYGNGSTTPYYDHTYGATGNGLVTGTYTPGSRGYMMVINADNNAGSIFYQDTIRNLCPNTQLYFEAWAGNIIQNTQTYSGRANPYLQFIVRDLSTLPPYTIIAQSTTKEIPKNAANTWTRISLDFMTGAGSGDIIVQVINTNPDTNGNDFVLDDFSVWLKVPDLGIAAPSCYGSVADANGVKTSYLCPGEPMDLSVTYDETQIANTFGTNPLVRWLYSTNPNDTIINWAKADDGKDLTIAAPNATTYYRVVIGSAASIENREYGCCSLSGIIKVNPIQLPETLYWKSDVISANWNNPRNWEHADRTAVPYAPRGCIDVHIPGNCLSYPVLDAANSTYSCACNHIYFHFGGMVGQPHLLRYDSAYVQYNFGIDGGNANGDLSYSAPNMQRGQWYALAAPLQKIASGDFGLGGYPNMYQQAFKASQQTPVDGTLTGNWYTPNNTTNWDIGNQYNAIAIWAGAQYGSNLDTYGEGANYQTGIEGLNGIFQMPYFDDSYMIAQHRLFYQSNDTSYFQYYDRSMWNFPPVDSFNFIVRGQEAYRFIFEGSPFTGAAGVYTMNNVTAPAGSPLIMVGNPFMSLLDFNAFSTDNAGINTYGLFVNGNFLYYNAATGTGDPGMTRYIAPLQAFFISPPASGKLTFNANTETVVAPVTANQLRSTGATSGDMKPDVLYLNAKSSNPNVTGQSWLTLSMQTEKETNQILILPNPSNNPGAELIPQIYATDATGQKNAIQFAGGYVQSVPLGVYSADNNATITVTASNVANLAVDSVVVWDNILKIKVVDLKQDNTFTLLPVADRYQLLMGNKLITGITPEPVANPVNAYVSGNTLYVNAVSEIADVSVVALQGITITQERNIGQTYYAKALNNLPAGIYLVSVKLATGEKRVVKVIKN